MPGPGSQRIGREEIAEVMDVLESASLFRYGNLEDPRYKHKVYTFEREFAAACGVRYALATSSGSGALICALKAIGTRPTSTSVASGFRGRVARSARATGAACSTLQQACAAVQNVRVDGPEAIHRFRGPGVLSPAGVARSVPAGATDPSRGSGRRRESGGDRESELVRLHPGGQNPRSGESCRLDYRP